MKREPIDNKRMREFASRLNSHYAGRTHFEGCEYYHLPCAVLRLCDELDAANVLLDEMYNQRVTGDLMTEDEIRNQFTL